MDKFIVTLTEEERLSLQILVSSGKTAARKLTHARILLLADATPEGLQRTDEEIQQALGVGLSTIHRVRQRFVMEGFQTALNPRPAPLRPDKIKLQGDLEKQLIALVCSDPPAGYKRWTLQLLADRLVELGHLEHLGKETVRQVLKKTTSDRGR